MRPATVRYEWSSRTSISDRRENLQTGGGLTNGNALDESSIFDDESRDDLTGNGGSDLFFAGAGDRVRDRTSSDRVVSFV